MTAPERHPLPVDDTLLKTDVDPCAYCQLGYTEAEWEQRHTCLWDPLLEVHADCCECH